MSHEITILSLTAASLGFFHTLLGPDHYVPFIAMAKARKWSYAKTMGIVTLCGIGHVGSSIVLGFLGIALGLTVTKLEIWEASRGNWAAWGLILFGLLYLIYGIRKAVRNKPHTHVHIHEDGVAHLHEHRHQEGHVHVHENRASSSIVPWSLFVVFVLGPCEPLIPLLMYPAAQQSFMTVFVVAGFFTITTLATMLGMVLVSTFGVNFLPLSRLERFSHALAGFAILMCGCGVQFLGF